MRNVGLIFWNENITLLKSTNIGELSHPSFPRLLVQPAHQEMENLNDPKDWDYEACLVPTNVACHWVNSL